VAPAYPVLRTGGYRRIGDNATLKPESFVNPAGGGNGLVERKRARSPQRRANFNAALGCTQDLGRGGTRALTPSARPRPEASQSLGRGVGRTAVGTWCGNTDDEQARDTDARRAALGARSLDVPRPEVSPC